MGNCSSNWYVSVPQSQQSQSSRAIDQQLKEESIQRAREVKILLLGAGESGKTTILKQMQILHTPEGFSAFQRDQYRRQIFMNLYIGIRNCLELMGRERIELADGTLMDFVPLFASYQDLEPWEPYPIAFFEPLSRFWFDEGVRKALAQKNTIISESIFYFFAKLEQLFDPEFTPSDQDILLCRRTTMGITEMTFAVSDFVYRIIDVGGQRSERKKWIHCFENVTAIIFLAAISSYDETLLEARDASQMVEALVLFDLITNSRWFTKTSLILFLNKIDLFKQKVLRSPVSRYFPDYRGDDSDYNAAQLYFTNRFLNLNRSMREIYTHYTCATDTALMRVVMASVNDAILKKNLGDMLM